MRGSVSLGLLLVAIVLLSSLSAVSTTLESPRSNEPSSEELYRFEGEESGVWPYVSTQKAVTRHGPMNLVVQAEPRQIVRALTTAPESNGEADKESNASTDSPIAPTPTQWKRTTGSPRYAYVSEGSAGEWIRETAHLMEGTYYGERHHARLYGSPNRTESWTAIQAHSEHYDWFTLGHVVENVEYAQARLETELTGDGQSVRVRQVDFENEDADGDGWASIIVFSMLVFPIALTDLGTTVPVQDSTDDDRPVAFRARLSRPVVGLGVTIAALVLGTRAAGLVFETVGIPLAAIELSLFPFLAIGVPVSTYLFGRSIARPTDAALTATVCFTAAMFVDYAILEVATLPLEIVTHRSGLVLALGVIAGGATMSARRESRFDGRLAVGAGLWLAFLLFGLLAL